MITAPTDRLKIRKQRRCDSFVCAYEKKNHSFFRSYIDVFVSVYFDSPGCLEYIPYVPNVCRYRIRTPVPAVRQPYLTQGKYGVISSHIARYVFGWMYVRARLQAVLKCVSVYVYVVGVSFVVVVAIVLTDS